MASSFRDRLRARGRPQVTHPILVGTRAELAAARAVLADAAAGLANAQASTAGPGALVLVEHYEQAVAAGRTAVAACYEHPTVTALAPEAMEELIAQHPPSDADQAKGATWDADTFVPELLAACVSFGPDEPSWTAEDWAAEMTSAGSLSLGEVTALFQTAVDVNGRAPDPSTGKG